MRIRKRQVHLSSSSSFSPLHLSDPHLLNRSPLVVQLNDATHNTSVLSQHDAVAAAPSSLDRYQPSDQTLQLIGKLPSNGCDDVSGIRESGVHKQLNKQHPLEEKVRGQESGDSGEKGNNTSNGDILVSQVLPSSTSLAQDGRWWEGEKAIPPKKRKGSLENGMEDKKMKTKMNKKCSMQKEEAEEDKEEIEGSTHVNVTKKKSKGSGVLMEGSRCSRVNGRGWRCCQQTLVGYSLCEHHLGKGRLRSMTSVRNRSLKKVHDTNNKVELSISDSSSSLEKQTVSGIDGDNVDEEKKAMVITKKRMKLGMVKARSMSSLLGQTNTQVSSVPDQEMNYK